MALSNIEVNVCDKMTDEFDKMHALTSVAANTTAATLSSLNNTLTGLGWSAPGDLATAIDDFNAAALKYIPGTSESDINSVLSMIKNCDFLNLHEILKNPICLIKGVIGPIFGKLDSLASTYAALFEEFYPANALKQLTDLFTTQGISTKMLGMDRAINCVNSLCGASYATKVTDMTDKVTTLYTTMKMIEDPLSLDYGKLNLTSVYDTAGLNAGQITAMTNVGNAVTTQKDAAVSQTSSIVDKIKARL